MRIPLCEAKYIQDARAVFAVRFPDGNFDDISWGIQHLFASQHGMAKARVYFTRYGSTVEPLPARFANIVKASVLLMDSFASIAHRVDVARVLWIGIEKRLGESHFSWSEVCDEDLLDAEQQMLQHWGAATTYKQCRMLQRMVDTLAAAPYGPIVRPLQVVFRTARSEDFERYTLEGQELRLAKMPPDATILALGKMFCRSDGELRDRLYFCVLAILLASGFRIWRGPHPSS